MARDVDLLAARVMQRLAELGLSAAAASIEATGKPDLVRDIQRGRMPNPVRLAALAKALQTSAEWLLTGSGQPDGGNLVYDPPATTPARLSAAIRDFRPMELPRDLPVLGAVLGSPYGNGGHVPVESHLVDMGDTLDLVRRPLGLAGVTDAYALYITGDSQAPRFKPGELIFVNPRRPPSVGDDVVVQLVDDDDRVVTALIKELVRRSGTTVTLRQFNPETTIDIPVARIRAIHRVIPWGELLGI